MDRMTIDAVRAPEPAAPVRVPAWRQRRRDRILNAAAELFAGRPYPLVSMDELAQAASMGKATLYRYYASKEDLYVAVFDMALERLAGSLDGAIAQGGGPEPILRRVIAALVPALGEHFRGLRTVDDGAAQVAERKRRLFRNRRHLIASRIESVLAAGIEAGVFRPMRVGAGAAMLVGMIWSCSVNLNEGSDAVAELVADMFLRGALSAPRH